MKYFNLMPHMCCFIAEVLDFSLCFYNIIIFSQEFTTGVTNQKVDEYIQLIEKENKSLHLKVKEAHAELRTSRVSFSIFSMHTH